ncbi:MAG: transketolase [Chloroflexota bacterium]
MTSNDKGNKYYGMDMDLLCINTIRTLSMDGVQKANSGHPGTPMANAPLAYLLYDEIMKHNPRDPQWPDRDRFILSVGHASMLLYSALYLFGYGMTLDDLKNFRQWGSRTAGHPEYGHAPGIETTTGPLGQGFGNGVGMALAERWLAERFNKPGYNIVDHYTYALCSDGDLMEGVASEAASIAGFLKLGKLIYFYDDNTITIDGHTDLAFSEDVGMRFEAYGWHVQHISDINDLDSLRDAVKQAKTVTDKPSLIIMKTVIAYGSPNKANTSESHGSPLGKDEIILTKQNLGWPWSEESFYVPDEALQHTRLATVRGEELTEQWQDLMARYEAEFPAAAAEYKLFLSGGLPEGWDDDLPSFAPEKGPLATRTTSGQTINAIASKVLNLMAGAADLYPSTDAYIKGGGDLSGDNFLARNVHYGIREHAMGAILQGIALHKGVIAFGSTFLIFYDYMRPPLRLAAIMKNPLLMLYTHDSIGLGEDGPTHQPVEQLSGLRSVPNLWTIRPGDANESVYSWKVALTRRDGPTVLVMTRQKLPVFNRDEVASAEGVLRGAYTLADADGGKPDLILIATGSEVHLALGARPLLQEQGIKTRVVSMPCWELFEEQDQSYRDEVLPPDVKKRISIEAASPMGWAKWVGSEGDIIAVETYGASAPAEIIFEKYGFTVDNVVQHGLALMDKRGPVPPQVTSSEPDRHDKSAAHERDMEKQGATQTEMETPAEKQS